VPFDVESMNALHTLGRRLASLALVAALPFTGTVSVSAQAPRPMVSQDLHQLTALSDPRISPDGGWIAFVVRQVTEDRRGREGGIWIVPSDGSAPPRPLTQGTRDAMPRWAPNGETLLYLESVAPVGSGADSGANPGAGGASGGAAESGTASASAGVRLQTIPRAGGTPSTVLHLRQGSIREAQWLRSGRILLTLNLDPAVRDPREPAPAPDPSTPDRTIIRDAVYQAEGVGILGPERQSLWVLDPAVGALSRVTPGDPRWNDRDATGTPNGERVVFQRDASGEEYDGAFARALWFLDLDATPGTEPVRMTSFLDGRAESPRWSPDGQSVLFRFRSSPYARTHLQVADRTPNPRGPASPRTLTLDADLDPQNPFWNPDGRAIYFTADSRGTHPLFRVNANGSDLRPLFGEDGVVSSPTISEDGRRLAFLYENEVNPPELWTAEADGRNPRPLTRFNRALLEGLDLSRVEEFEFLNDAGQLLQGFLIRPVGWQREATYPMVLNIKGGPGGMWGRRWFPEFQILSGAGYAVVFVNYRGSSGYGHAFQSAVRLDYGGGDARDNLALVDEVLSRNPWIDRSRLFITGGSHGGFLTNWITTETTRFRAAVTQRSVSNWISEAGTQAYPPRAMREEFGGTIWDNYALYWERSPLSRANRVRTPTLILHSDQDRITPLGQGQEWFFALKALGVPTEMVIFHGEGHELSRSGTPVNLVERIDRILEWFARWDATSGGEG
jgi:dipeptidyl aminopeptidase/acylaminoacyl peptidase